MRCIISKIPCLYHATALVRGTPILWSAVRQSFGPRFATALVRGTVRQSFGPRFATVLVRGTTILWSEVRHCFGPRLANTSRILQSGTNFDMSPKLSWESSTEMACIVCLYSKSQNIKALQVSSYTDPCSSVFTTSKVRITKKLDFKKGPYSSAF